MRVKALVMIAVTLILATTAWASSETVLYNVDGFSGDGEQPYTGLVADAKGNLYGTTVYGTATNGTYGTVFELSLSGGTWTETVLHSFGGVATGDGAYPEYSSLVFDKAGNLYGTTYQGGTKNDGTVFELKHSGSSWTETVIHSFTNIAPDGYGPQAGLSFDSAGYLYGTTQYGGSHSAGTVFQMKPSNGSWKYKVIHAFVSPGGYYPVGGLTQGKNGYYYGTTYNGGTPYNAGTVYRLFQSRGVWVGQTIYVFGGDTLGANPDSSLTMDAAGNFFGTTYYGGTLNIGTVFELKAGSNNKFTYSVLYSFLGNPDGNTPFDGSGVTLDAKGDLFGTTYAGGTNNAGSVYELKLTSGHYKEHVLWSFGGSGDGYYPRAGVILVKGKVYGTTYAGGAHGQGTVFEVTP